MGDGAVLVGHGRQEGDEDERKDCAHNPSDDTEILHGGWIHCSKLFDGFFAMKHIPHRSN